MPVVPEPPEEEMPRMEILSVPAVSTLMPGVKRARSPMSLMQRASMSSADMAVMLIGTLLRDCSRRVAVTTTSCNPGVSAAPASAGAAAPAAPGSASVASATKGTQQASRRAKRMDACIAYLPEIDPITEQDRCHAFFAFNLLFGH